MDPSGLRRVRVRAVDLGRGRVRSRARSSDCVTGREGRGSSDSEKVLPQRRGSSPLTSSDFIRELELECFLRVASWAKAPAEAGGRRVPVAKVLCWARTYCTVPDSLVVPVGGF